MMMSSTSWNFVSPGFMVLVTLLYILERFFMEPRFEGSAWPSDAYRLDISHPELFPKLVTLLSQRRNSFPFPNFGTAYTAFKYLPVGLCSFANSFIATQIRRLLQADQGQEGMEWILRSRFVIVNPPAIGFLSSLDCLWLLWLQLVPFSPFGSFGLPWFGGCWSGT
ncbi:hypothetical protein BZA77DRAFT_66693 [Pyronema omphalodes]|nr:hypothetical protein BZA77DRAFT_66693 [Pyronema omphalodes]